MGLPPYMRCIDCGKIIPLKKPDEQGNVFCNESCADRFYNKHGGADPK